VKRAQPAADTESNNADLYYSYSAQDLIGEEVSFPFADRTLSNALFTLSTPRIPHVRALACRCASLCIACPRTRTCTLALVLTRHRPSPCASPHTLDLDLDLASPCAVTSVPLPSRHPSHVRPSLVPHIPPPRFTCFCTPGMFSAISNLGAGGTQDVTLPNTANGDLYGSLTLTGFISGGICNGA